MLKPSAVKGYECDLCDSLLSTEDALERHMMSHPRQGGKHKCHLCSYSALYPSDLLRHVRTHTGERPHKCSVCGVAFSNKSNMLTHVRSHTGERPYVCGTCGKTFTRAGHLRSHELTHGGILCRICGKGFVYRGDLTKHELVHSGKKPYSCSHCDYRATRLLTLQRHIISQHTKEFPYVCPICGKGFSVSSFLMNHLSQKHPESKMGPTDN